MNAFQLTNIAVASCAGAIGIPGNIFIVFVFSRRKNKNPTDVAVIALALLDLFLCLLLIEGSATSKTVRWLCVVENMLKDGISIAGLFITLFIAVCRYFAVCRPFSTRFSSPLAWTVSAASVVISILIYLPIAFHTRPAKNSQGIAICNAFGNDDLLRKIYVALPSVLAGSSLSIIVVLYVKIYSVIRHHQALRERMTNGLGASDAKGRISSISATVSKTKSTANISTPTDRQPSVQSSSAPTAGDDVSSNADTKANDASGLGDVNVSINHKKPRCSGTEEPHKKRTTGKKQQADHKTTKMLVIATIFFFVLLIPELAIKLLTTEQKFRLAQTLPKGVAILTFLYNLHYINQFINIFIYLIANKKFRGECVQIFKS
ncbi:uncharacterized protein LOC115927892 [Strongylocentrotus purpuratus]|uniref:G-protein coupled receptors family 1 profile domain-containing protein n=1 Tax=Strongylocentrotus purpuratus TaxID=7668 RepID=A0A7M7PGR2_STRPU|nr:uncharacterized protein LOC115927887 [Strongylocentrotus purpuratus]XP_030850061.1 uncharacterized protein LOC115927892 [Strongylocentrotus purpuratus]